MSMSSTFSSVFSSNLASSSTAGRGGLRPKSREASERGFESVSLRPTKDGQLLHTHLRGGVKDDDVHHDECWSKAQEVARRGGAEGERWRKRMALTRSRRPSETGRRDGGRRGDEGAVQKREREEARTTRSLASGGLEGATNERSRRRSRSRPDRASPCADEPAPLARSSRAAGDTLLGSERQALESEDLPRSQTCEATSRRSPGRPTPRARRAVASAMLCLVRTSARRALEAASNLEAVRARSASRRRREGETDLISGRQAESKPFISQLG